MKDIPTESRPREKLLARGADALSDAELLALLLRTGMKGKPVLVLAQELLDSFGGMAGLLQADLLALGRIKGLGPAKRAELTAVLALAQRALLAQLKAVPVLDTPQALHQFLRHLIGSLPHEVFVGVFLDHSQRLIAHEVLFRGTLSQTSVYPREVALRALHHNASAMVVAHNHPSGQLEPSASDVALTRILHGALGLLDVRLIDHLVVHESGSVSMAESGLMP
jgi:DNA repair protein RadC